MESKGRTDRGSESFRRAGSVPFQWEIQPGVPKHTAAKLHAVGSPPPPPPPTLQKLRPPPAVLSRSVSTSSSVPRRGGGGEVGAACFRSLSSRRNQKRTLKIFSLLRRFRFRSVSDRFVSRSSPPSWLAEEDEYEFRSSGSSRSTSDSGSFC